MTAFYEVAIYVLFINFYILKNIKCNVQWLLCQCLLNTEPIFDVTWIGVYFNGFQYHCDLA